MPKVSKGKRANGKTNLQTIESIGPKHAAALEKAGVNSVEELLAAGRTRSGRHSLAGKTDGVTEHQVLQWCNRADLMRIKGIGEEWSDLLEAAGVDTVKELKHRKAENLHRKLGEVAAKAHGNQPGAVKRIPSKKQVQRFINTARLMKAGMEY